MDTTYNGWTDYKTWNVKLWLDNEQGTYSDVMDLAKNARSGHDLADKLEEYVNEMRPDSEASMFSDILGNALATVNWGEIADSYLEELSDYEVN